MFKQFPIFVKYILVEVNTLSLASLFGQALQFWGEFIFIWTMHNMCMKTVYV